MGRASILFGAVALVSVITLWSCSFREEKLGVSPASGELNYTFISQNILAPDCLTCHSSMSGHIDLSSYDKLLLDELVVPFRPEKSRLYMSITTGSMPKNQPKLRDEKIQAVFEWISKGADTSGTTPTPTPTPTPNPPVPTFTWISKNIFQTQKCVGCHNPANKKGDTDLSTHEGLLNSGGMLTIPLVPGDPLNSGVYTQVKQGAMPPPLGPPKLTPEELKCMFDWIEQGAKNN